MACQALSFNEGTCLTKLWSFSSKIICPGEKHNLIKPTVKLISYKNPKFYIEESCTHLTLCMSACIPVKLSFYLDNSIQRTYIYL